MQSDAPFEWRFYLFMNPEIVRHSEISEQVALNHWIQHGQYENRIAAHPDRHTFDVDYYRARYTDVGNNASIRDILTHWYRHGKREGRRCCPRPSKPSILPVTDSTQIQFEKIVQKRLATLTQIVPRPDTKREDNSQEPESYCLRIITRTSRRPNAFALCRYSVLCQNIPTHLTVVHHILYDNPLDTFYIEGDIITLISHETLACISLDDVENTDEFIPNTYINEALKIEYWKQEDFTMKIDWNIVLDDDDMFLDPNALTHIYSHLIRVEEPALILWNTQMSEDMVLPGTYSGTLERGKLPSCSFAFNAAAARYQWPGIRGGDFQFAYTITQHSQHEPYFISKTLTGLQSQAGWGECIDTPLLEHRRHSLELLNTYQNLKQKQNLKIIKQNALSSFFDTIYVLNLERRLDRFTQTCQRLAQYNISTTRFIGIDGKHDLSCQLYWKQYNRIPRTPPCIPSIGSLAILHSMRNLIVHAQNASSTQCLVFQDDVLLCHNFEQRCATFLSFVTQTIPDWKLIYLGCTQHVWPTEMCITNIPKHSVSASVNDSDEPHTIQNIGFYYPQGTADGAFAVAIHSSIYNDVIELIGTSDLPFDSGPLRSIQRKWPKQCVCAWPYLVIADVSDSDCRESRSQKDMAQKVRWDLEDFTLD